MNVKLSFTSGDWDRSAVDEHSAGLARYGTRVRRSMILQFNDEFARSFKD